jgi:hypothetical protein
MRPEGFYRVPDTEPEPETPNNNNDQQQQQRGRRRSTSRGHRDTIHEEPEAAWQDFLSRQQAAIEHKAQKVKALALQVLAEEAGKGVGAVSNLHSGGAGGNAAGPVGVSTPASSSSKAAGPGGLDPAIRDGSLKLPSELRSVAAALRTPTLSAGTRKILAQAQLAQQKAEKAVAGENGGADKSPNSGKKQSTNKIVGKALRAASATPGGGGKIVLRGNGSAASATTSAVVAVNRAQSQTRSRSHLRSAAAAAAATPSAKSAAGNNNEDDSGTSPASVQRSRAPTHVSAASGVSRPGSEALYANAMGKLQRQKQAIKAADNAAKRATEVKANSKSDALLRQRLGREVAAACVFIAARRAVAAAGATSTTPNNADEGATTGNSNNSESVVPWWLLELTPSEVSDILVHCGFLGEPALPKEVSDAAARGVFEWQLPAAARFDGVPIPQQQSQGEGGDGDEHSGIDTSFDTTTQNDDNSNSNNMFSASARSRTRSISTRRSISGGGGGIASARSRSASGSSAGHHLRTRSGSRERLDFPPSAFVPVVTMGGSTATPSMAAAAGTTVNGAVPVGAVHLQSARLFARVWDALTWTGVMDRVTGALSSSSTSSPSSSSSPSKVAALSLSMAAAASGGMGEANVANDDPTAMSTRLQSLQSRVTAVRLLALLQALLTGGYDVRRKTLSACGSDIGLAHPFLTLPSTLPSAAAANTAAATEAAAALSSSPVKGGATTSPLKKDTAEATQQLPPAFASALKAHSERLRGLSSALFAGRLPPASPPPAPLSSSSSTAAAASSADSAVTTAGAGIQSHTQTLLAQEVLEGRLLWPIHVLIPLQRLYSNRLAYLGNLTRRDTRQDVGMGAAAEIVTLSRKASAASHLSAGSGGGLTNPLAIQAPAAPILRQRGAPHTSLASGHATPALLSPFTSSASNNGGGGGVDGSFSSNPLAAVVAATNADPNTALPLGPGMSISDAQECTFQPMLCKKSLAIAGRQEWEKGGRRAGIGGGVDGTPHGHAIALAASGKPKDPNSPLAMPSSLYSANNMGSGSNVMSHGGSSSSSSAQKVPREVALMEFAARTNARLKHARAQRIADELAECSFKPDLSKGKHILQPPQQRGVSASSSGSGASGTHTPSSSAQNNSNAGGAAGDDSLNNHLAANLGLLPGSNANGGESGEDNATAAGRSSVVSNNNNGGLTRGELLYSLAALRTAELARARQEAMIARSAAELEGCTFAPQIHASPRARRVARSLASASGPGALSGDAGSGSTYGNRAVQRGRGEQASGAAGGNRSARSKEPIPEALAAALLPRVADSMGSPGHLAARLEERKRMRSLLGELAQAAETGGLAHLGLSSSGAAAADAAPDAAAGPFPHGMSSHLARMARSAAQRAQREQLQSALSAGVLHKVKERILGAVSLTGEVAPGAEEGGDEQQHLHHQEANDGQPREGENDVALLNSTSRRSSDENNNNGLGSPSEPPAAGVMPPVDPSKLAASLPQETLQALAYQALLQQLSASQQLLNGSGATTTTNSSMMMQQQQPQPLPASVLMPSALGNSTGNTAAAAAASLAASLLRNSGVGVVAAPASSAAAGDYTSITADTSSALMQQQQQQQRGPPLLFVDVAISPSSSDRIPLWKDTDCGAAAQAFASKHDLSAKMQARLQKMLVAQRDALLLGPSSSSSGQQQQQHQVAAQ